MPGRWYSSWPAMRFEPGVCSRWRRETGFFCRPNYKQCKLFGVALLTIVSVFGCASEPEVAAVSVTPVPAAAETDAMKGEGDRADDPAIWVHPETPAESLILGTNKEEGLYVYDLAGSERQRLPVGRVNNVDVRGSLAVASNDEVGGLSWFGILKTPSHGQVLHLGDTLLTRVEPYGVCLGQSGDQLLTAVTYKDGTLEIWDVEVGAGRRLPAIELFREVSFGSQLEGCVFDDQNRRLFIGEEEYGVWSLDLESADAAPASVDTIGAGNGLVADVEGLSLYIGERDRGFLVASAQAADRFVVYQRRPPHRPLGVFSVVANPDGSIDGVSHTDGLDISSAAMGRFPAGVVVVQDDGNPASGVDQNFKLVDWREIERALGLD